MLTYLCYALATICFALSVACLGLWIGDFEDCRFAGPAYYSAERGVLVEFYDGLVSINIRHIRGSRSTEWTMMPRRSPETLEAAIVAAHITGRFRVTESSVLFPLWYPALVFALAGVGALRLGRRFTLRSAIIATTVVAGLLGIVVAL